MAVYVDLLFAVNLALNCWALWLSSVLIGHRLQLGSLLLSASLGAVYALGLVTPWAHLFTHPAGKLLLAVAMVVIAFRPHLVMRVLSLTGLFLVVSCLTAGCVLGIYGLINNGQSGTLAYGQLPLWVLALAVVALALGSQRVISLLENRLVHVANRADLTFQLDGRVVHLTGLVDSGNQLADPLGGRPVAVVSLAALADVLPEEIVALASSDSPWEQSLVGLAEHAWAGRVRFIPFRSVGRRSGMLLGFGVDQVAVSSAAGCRETENVVLALSRDPLSDQDAYQVLIPLRLLPAARSVQEVPS